MLLCNISKLPRHRCLVDANPQNMDHANIHWQMIPHIYLAPRSYSALGNTRVLYQTHMSISAHFNCSLMWNFWSQWHNLFLECACMHADTPQPYTRGSCIVYIDFSGYWPGSVFHARAHRDYIWDRLSSTFIRSPLPCHYVQILTLSVDNSTSLYTFRGKQHIKYK